MRDGESRSVLKGAWGSGYYRSPLETKLLCCGFNSTIQMIALRDGLNGKWPLWVPVLEHLVSQLVVLLRRFRMSSLVKEVHHWRQALSVYTLFSLLHSC